MSRELRYILNPMKSRLRWLLFYMSLFAALLMVFYMTVGRIKTHSLPSGQVELSVSYTKYLLGEPITFTVTNNFNSDIYAVNNCPDVPLGVYRFEGGKWVRIHGSAAKDCTAEDRRVVIPANSSKSVSLSPWTEMFNQPGKYRLIVFVEYYNALPYKDIEIVASPVVSAIPGASPAAGGSASGGGSRSTEVIENKDDSEEEAEQQVNNESDDYQPATYNVQVNSSGNYNVTSLNLKKGDSVKFTYTNPDDEVRTRFTPISAGSPAISSLTLDEEHSSGTKKFDSVGSWRYKADDHNGNSGTIVVQ